MTQTRFMLFGAAKIASLDLKKLLGFISRTNLEILNRECETIFVCDRNTLASTIISNYILGLYE